MSDKEKIENAMGILLDYVGTDGEHHKQHCIVEVIKILAGDQYEEVKRDYCDGEDGPNTYDEWDVGIPG